MKALLSTLLIIFCFSLNAQSSYNYEEVIGNSKKEIDLSGKFAMYPEGEKGLRTYLMQNLQYPDLAVEKKLEEKVTIEYSVSKKGKVKHIRVKNGEHKILIKATKRVLKNMTNWKPGEVHGKRIATQYQQEFNFVLL